MPNPNGAAVHSTLHNGEYYPRVNELLAGAQSREEVVDILEYVRSSLLAGETP